MSVQHMYLWGRYDHSRSNASMSIPWALWFWGWMKGRTVVLFWNRKSCFQNFLHTANICPCGPEIMFSSILLKLLKPKWSWLPKFGACQLSWESWAFQVPHSVGSRQHCWSAATVTWLGWVSMLHHSLSEIFPTNPRYEWPKASSSYTGTLATFQCCQECGRDPMGSLGWPCRPKVLKGQIFCLVVLPFQMWSL